MNLIHCKSSEMHAFCSPVWFLKTSFCLWLEISLTVRLALINFSVFSFLGNVWYHYFFSSYFYCYFIIYFHSIFCFFLKVWCFTIPSLYQYFLHHLEHYFKIFRFLCPQLLWILIFSIFVIKQAKVVKYIYIDAESCMHRFSIAASITRK